MLYNPYELVSYTCHALYFGGEERKKEHMHTHIQLSVTVLHFDIHIQLLYFSEKTNGI